MANQKGMTFEINPEDLAHISFTVGEVVFLKDFIEGGKGLIKYKEARSAMEKLQEFLTAYSQEQIQKKERENETTNVDRCNSVADASGDPQSG